MSGNAGELFECELKTLITSYHTAFLVRSSWKDQTGIDRLLGKDSGRIQFIDQATGLLHSMVHYGCGAAVTV